MAQQVKNPAVTQEMQVRSLGQEDPPEEGLAIHSSEFTPLQCLKNPMDRGAWRATVRGVAKNQTRLKPLNTHTMVTSPD